MKMGIRFFRRPQRVSIVLGFLVASENFPKNEAFKNMLFFILKSATVFIHFANKVMFTKNAN